MNGTVVFVLACQMMLPVWVLSDRSGRLVAIWYGDTLKGMILYKPSLQDGDGFESTWGNEAHMMRSHRVFGEKAKKKKLFFLIK